MNSLLGPGLVPGNEISTLRNGDEIFPAMRSANQDLRARQIGFQGNHARYAETSAHLGQGAEQGGHAHQTRIVTCASYAPVISTVLQ
jgi:hypothetical protein